MAKSLSLGRLAFNAFNPVFSLSAPSTSFGVLSESLATPSPNAAPPAVSLLKSSFLAASPELICEIPSDNLSIPLFNVALPALSFSKSSF